MNSKSLGRLAINVSAHSALGCVLFLAALAMPAFNSGCQSSAKTHLVNELPVVTLAAAENSNLTIRWKAHIGLAPLLNEHVTSVIRSKDVIYVITNKNQLVVLNAAAGTKTWSQDFGDDSLPIFPPVEIKYKLQPALAVYNRLKLYILDRRDGRILERSNLDFDASSPAVVFNNILCIGSEHQFFYGTYIDLLGKIAWSVREADDSFTAAPALTAEGNVVFCSRKGKIWKVSADTGLAGWNHMTTGDVVGGLVADSHAVYIPSLDHKLYAFELYSSKRLWAARLDGQLDQIPMVVGANVLAVGAGSGLYSVDIARGETHWFVPNVRQIISHTPDHVFVSDTSGNILAISLDTGSIDSTTPTSDANVFAFNTVDGTIYAVSADGRIVALEAAK